MTIGISLLQAINRPYVGLELLMRVPDCICMRQAFSLLCQYETGVHKFSLLGLAIQDSRPSKENECVYSVLNTYIVCLRSRKSTGNVSQIKGFRNLIECRSTQLNWLFPQLFCMIHRHYTCFSTKRWLLNLLSFRRATKQICTKRWIVHNR